VILTDINLRLSTVLWWLVVGLVAGLLASLIGLGANGLVGTIIIAFIGACILIAVLRFFSRRSPRRCRRRLSSTVFLH
jgi:predicted PurR-regulated permease PerM